MRFTRTVTISAGLVGLTTTGTMSAAMYRTGNSADDLGNPGDCRYFQQILGSCAPVSISIDLLTPMIVFRATFWG